MSDNLVPQAQEIYSLLMPAAGDSILLPNTAVAEVVPYFGNVDKPEPGAPDYLLGFLQWRGRHVPLMTMEVINGQPAPQLTRLARLAILNTLNGNADVPFVAVIVGGIPRLTRVLPGLLEPVDASNYPAAKVRAHLAGQTIQIPDIDKFEQLARDALPFKPEKMGM